MGTPSIPVTDRKARSHERIVDAAARAIKRHGVAGVGVADVMREAGLTHGGFYAHFPSRDALLVAALERAAKQSGDAFRRRPEGAGAAVAAAPSSLRRLVDSYLDERLLVACDEGCPVAALASEMVRQDGAVRDAAVTRVRSMVAWIARTLPEDAADEAPGIAATLVGALQLARILGPTPEGRAVLASTRASLYARFDLD